MRTRFFTWSLAVGGALLLVLALSFWPLFRILTVADQLPRFEAAGDDNNARREAMQWLSFVGETDRLVIPTLLEMLADPPTKDDADADDPDRFDPLGNGRPRNAANLFENLGGEATAPLVAASILGDELTRARAVVILGQSGSSRWLMIPVHAIGECLKTDPSPLVRRSAALALGKTKDLGIEEPMEQEPDAPVPEGMECSWYENTWADHRLMMLRRAVTWLGAALDDPDERVRLQAAHSIGELEDPRGAPYLAALFGRPAWEFTDVPEKSLAKLKGPQTTALLTEYLKSPSARLRERAAIALTEMADPATLDALLAAAGDPQTLVRARVAEALGKIGAPAAERLGTMLAGPDPVLGDTAEQAFGHMEMRDLVPVTLLKALSDPREEVRCRAARALGRARGDKAAEALALRAGDPSVVVRRAFVQALADLGSSAGAAALAKALKDPDREIRDIASEGLTSARSAEAAGLLMDMLADRDRDVALRAARALGHQREAALGERLAPLLEDPDPAIREAAATSIGELKYMGAGAIVKLLKDREPRVRRAAVVALRELGARVGVEDLAELAATKAESLGLRTDALHALGAIGGPVAARALAAALGDETPLVRQVATDELGGVASLETVDALIAALDDPTTRALARESLQRVVWRDFGAAPAAWREWWQARGKAAFTVYLTEPDPPAPPPKTANTGQNTGSGNILFSTPDSPGAIKRILGGNRDQEEGILPSPSVWVE